MDLAIGEVWYRYRAQSYASADEDDRVFVSSPRLELDTYPVISHTPKGVWLDEYGTKRFVLASARKRFACPSEPEARASFVARKERQIRILEAQIANAREALRLAEERL